MVCDVPKPDDWPGAEASTPELFNPCVPPTTQAIVAVAQLVLLVVVLVVVFGQIKH
jgi:hypothetical protein